MKRWLGWGGLIVGLAGLAAWLGAPSLPPAVPAWNLGSPSGEGVYQGVASCTAGGCHHANGHEGTRGSEYSLWVRNDPHANAYRTLFDERSIRMAKLLGRQEPSQDPLCLNCHVHGDFAKTTRHSRYSLLDGVGCESCHGPAHGWLHEHHHAGWRQLDAGAKKAKGMADTTTLLERAKTCVPCHVGEPGSEVTHDLIAAGHPRLQFEFSAYFETLPRHWNEAKDRARYPDREARAWEVSQVVCGEAFLRLLAAHAQGGRARAWPEFADFDCFACHHDLKPKGWRQEQPSSGQAGALALSSWHALPGGKPLASLRAEMRTPAPRPEVVRQVVNKLLKDLEKQAAQVQIAPQLDGKALRARLQAFDRRPGNWDEAVQLYQGRRATIRAWPWVTQEPLPAGIGAQMRVWADSLTR